jgi:hypothetical protein
MMKSPPNELEMQETGNQGNLANCLVHDNSSKLLQTPYRTSYVACSHSKVTNLGG